MRARASSAAPPSTWTPRCASSCSDRRRLATPRLQPWRSSWPASSGCTCCRSAPCGGRRSRRCWSADLHMGKAHSFRRMGVPVPAGSGHHVARSAELVQTWRPDAQSWSAWVTCCTRPCARRAPAGLLRRWRAAHAGLALTLVRGNHDDRAGDPPPDLDIRLRGRTLADQPVRCATTRGRSRVAMCWPATCTPASVWVGRARDRCACPVSTSGRFGRGAAGLRCLHRHAPDPPRARATGSSWSPDSVRPLPGR
jgi:hypothetical protein